VLAARAGPERRSRAKRVALGEHAAELLARSAEQPEATVAEIVVTPCKRAIFSQRAVPSFDLSINTTSSRQIF
jgi:hypothetical protein